MAEETEFPTNEQLEAMDELELASLADKRGLIVEGAEGEEPTHEDYVRALSAGSESGIAAKGPAVELVNGKVLDHNTPTNTVALQGKRLDQTIKGGKYLGRDGKYRNAHGKEIEEDGTVIKQDEE